MPHDQNLFFFFSLSQSTICSLFYSIGNNFYSLKYAVGEWHRFYVRLPTKQLYNSEKGTLIIYGNEEEEFPPTTTTTPTDTPLLDQPERINIKKAPFLGPFL
jgi:hypothetical protein